MKYIYGILPKTATIETKRGWALVGNIKATPLIKTDGGWMNNYVISEQKQRLRKNYYIIYQIITDKGIIEVLKETYFYIDNKPIHFEDLKIGDKILSDAGEAEVLYIAFSHREDTAYYLTMITDSPVYIKTKNNNASFLLSFPVKREPVP